MSGHFWLSDEQYRRLARNCSQAGSTNTAGGSSNPSLGRLPEDLEMLNQFLTNRTEFNVGGFRMCLIMVDKFRKSFALMMACLLLALPVSAADNVKPTATLTIDQTEIAFLVSGKLGGGTLSFKGKQHRFDIGGLGVGGIGIAKLRATGDVYHLENIKDFAGSYGQARTGIVVSGVGEMKGGLWLRNLAGVVIYLKPDREGVMLNLGADAIVIVMK